MDFFPKSRLPITHLGTLSRSPACLTFRVGKAGLKDEPKISLR
jgi:hypothetical protein